MALDNGYKSATQALPIATDTLYETPFKDISKPPLQHTSSSPPFTIPFAPFSSDEGSRISSHQGIIDTDQDERYNARDPRRLTPNLGISFVSQIHSLKKELETKDDMIGNLEESLHESRAQNERLEQDLEARRAEVKFVKHQMSSLELDMLQALEDVAKERDDANQSVAEGRKRLEESKMKVRSQEEDVNRTLLLWEKDKQDWESNKRKLESKVHVVEERLKTVVAALVAVHNTSSNHPEVGYDSEEDMGGTWFDVRASTASRTSNRSLNDARECIDARTYRASRMSGLHEIGGSNMSGLSLAEELEIGEADENDVYSPDALPEEIQIHEISKRYSEDQKARKLMGIITDNHVQTLGGEKPGQQSTDIVEDYISVPGKRSFVSYTDTATQFTPPPTPMVQDRQETNVSEKQVEQIEHSANQSRKRVAIPPVCTEQVSVKQEGSKVPSSASIGCQTDKPAHSLKTQSADTGMSTEPLSLQAVSNNIRSMSTQTMGEIAIVSKSADTRLSPALDVPVIAIHPPSSRPPSSHNSVVLPPRTRNAGCQVAIELPKTTISTSVQTEEIRIDKRHVKIPPRLQLIDVSTNASSQASERKARIGKPSAPQSRFNARSPALAVVEQTESSAPDVPARSSRRPSTKAATEQRLRPTLPQYEHPSSDSRIKGLSDPNKIEILDDFSDNDEFANAVPIRKTLSKVQNSWRLVPQFKEADLGHSDPASEKANDQKVDDASIKTDLKTNGPKQITSRTFQSRAVEGFPKPASTTRPSDIRRQALVSSGIAEHAQRARSPSVPGASGTEAATVAPPFPVPTRSSSRKIPISASEGAASPTPHTTSFFTARRGNDKGKLPSKRKILRKVQSAAAVPKSSGARPPLPIPSTSASSTLLTNPKSVPHVQNQFIIPYEGIAEMPSPAITTPRPRPLAGEASIETPSQQTSVVDAIAQTMVGEWMWKYIRKRSSFGITESPQAEFEMGRSGETGNNSSVRHKRWVWLAPYENAVIWSSKQPNSGPALLGKGGRKMMIQSVLDVKDDTPLPKNAGSQSPFDRSILILTPQRALKFTAVSKERHYIWLTALSFLSHSTRGMDDLATPPPLPQQEYQPPPPQEPNTSFRRTAVRDSIRVAKARSRPSLGAHSFSTPIGEGQYNVAQDTLPVWEDEHAESEDAAEPPQIPRAAAHARKRSSTGPRPVPLSALHSYPANSQSSSSLQGPTSRDRYDRFVPGSHGSSHSGLNKMTYPSMTRRVTDGSVIPAPVVPDNFFDPAGTMRMEAFVMDQGENTRLDHTPANPAETRKESRSYRTRKGRKKDLNYWGVEERMGQKAQEAVRTREEDPFMGF